MTENTTHDSPVAAPPLASTAVYLGCVILMFSIFAVDLVIPLGIAVGVMYVVVVLLTVLSPNARFTILIAGISTVLTIGALVYKPSDAETWLAVTNRGLAVFIIWVTTFLITKVIVVERKLVEMATHDFLTGLLNRREMSSRLSQEVIRSNRLGKPFSIMMIDVDNFKKINDTHGHTTGDKVLKEAAQRLDKAIRDYDFVSRYGGEEFVVATPEITVHDAQELAERLRRIMMEVPFHTETGTVITVTISVGVTQLRQGESAEKLISRADAALYMAKESGRNRVTVL